MTKDYYEILGVSKTATPEEIKKAYRKLSLKWHPDRQVGKSLEEKEQANKKMQEVNGAYECLSDPARRRHYDLTGEDKGSSPPPPAEEPPWECDKCGKKFKVPTWQLRDWPYSGVKSKVVKTADGKFKEEKERVDFCSPACFNNFVYCIICGEVGKKGKTFKYYRKWNAHFCSTCYEKWSVNCSHCSKKVLEFRSVNFVGKSEPFCSVKCAREWEKSNLNQRGDSRGEAPLVDPSTGGENERDGNGSGDGFRPSNGSHEIPKQNKKDNSQDFPDLSLIQSQTQAEQEIEKLLKENGISEQELNQEGILEGTDWKSYLKKLDTPQKVAEFMEKMRQNIIALKAKKMAESSSNKDKDPSNDKILPIVILVVSFLALTSLILIIVRKRRQRGF